MRVLEGYDTAQICMNGHVVTATARSNPRFRKSFCDKCGEPTTMECPECGAPVQGSYHDLSAIGFPDYHPPNYCHNCGKPFSWTTRAIDAAAQLVSDDESLTDEETATFQRDLREIVRDSPQARVSANRIKKFLGKATAETASAIREILLNSVSESAKKMIWP